MKKIFLLFCCCVNLIFAFSKEKINVGILNGPSSIPLCFLLENQQNFEFELKHEKFANPQSLLPKLLKKELNIGFLPVNVAAKVFNSTNRQIVCLKITGNGNISLITKDKNIKKINDLKGKEVFVAGQGAMPEYLFKYLLTKNKIPFDVKNGIVFNFSIPNVQIAPLLISDKIKYAVVPEPFSTIAMSKSDDVFCALDFQNEFIKISKQKENYPLTVMIAEKTFLENHKDLVLLFLQQYKKSYEWIIKNPKNAGILCEKHDLGINHNIAEKTILNANFTFENVKESQKKIEQILQIFIDLDKSSLSTLPTNEFYFNE